MGVQRRGGGRRYAQKGGTQRSAERLKGQEEKGEDRRRMERNT